MLELNADKCYCVYILVNSLFFILLLQKIFLYRCTMLYEAQTVRFNHHFALIINISML